MTLKMRRNAFCTGLTKVSIKNKNLLFLPLEQNGGQLLSSAIRSRGFDTLANRRPWGGVATNVRNSGEVRGNLDAEAHRFFSETAIRLRLAGK